MKVLFAAVAISTLVGGASVSVAQQDAQDFPSCYSSEYAVTLYGQTVCPDEFNQEDDYKRWNEMRANLDKLLPDASGEETKNPPALCEHIKLLKNKYSADAIEFVLPIGSNLEARVDHDPKIAAFIEPYRLDEDVALEAEGDTRPVDFAIRDAMSGDDEEAFNTLLSFFSEKNQIKILMVRETARRAEQLTLLYDSALDMCPDYAQMMGYYKILNYNGPDADYDPAEDPGWEALEKQWEANRKAAQEAQEKQGAADGPITPSQ